ncbi:MAG: FHA domain-containing protein [Defluviitaleaceae bacterium]|nr:FHA domain-containing protein [Defluviitaleaceae bacterium]
MEQQFFNQTTRHQQPIIVNTGALHLTIIDGTSSPIEIDLSTITKNTVTIGRGDSTDIKLQSPYASRRHCQIRKENGQYIIEDTDSVNGLILNGYAITHHVIQDGDNIRIDDGRETTQSGVLLSFTRHNTKNGWQTISLVNRMTTTIGRDPSSDVVLDHIGVSKSHAKITAKANKYYLQDNNSTNGIMINGKKVDGKVQLREKDIIIITNSQLIFSNGQLSYCCFNRGFGIQAHNIVKKVKDSENRKQLKTICNNVSLDINPCEMVAIVGGSGAGKSTIMNCISGYDRATSGSTYVNGIDLYQNYDALKNIIGYVPQQDIVFDNLTVQDMLTYAAKLRLPTDTTERERQSAVANVITTVELTGHENKLIKQLSGGQKKRTSIAVELLSNPTLFFLDEPASGLDPGTEQNLMQTLKLMAASGKTIIFVTHSTLNLQLCDKIIFMGPGGYLCFCGTYQEALRFFNVDDLVYVYNLIKDNPQYYRDMFIRGQKAVSPPAGNNSYQKPTAQSSLLPQTIVLLRRHMRILLNDRKRLGLILLQAPILIFFVWVVEDGNQFEQLDVTRNLLFVLSCAAFWIGMFNSLQEICEERIILKREYMAGLRLDAYILSKLLKMAIICAVLSVILTTAFALLVGLPSQGVVFSPYAEFLITTFFTSLSAAAMGLFVSSVSKNADKATSYVPFLLMPQIIFSGIVFRMEGAAEIFSWLTICRFSVAGYGTTSNLNSLPTRLQQAGFDIPREAENFFSYTSSNFAFNIAILCLFVVVFSVLARLALQKIGNEKD